MPFTVSRIFSPAALLYSFVVITRFGCGFYLGRQLEPPPALALVYQFAFLWVVGWWLVKDGRERRVAAVYDVGFFLSVAWPIVMTYYLVKTRGARGILYVLVFIGAYVGAALVGVILSVTIALVR
jgi:hypothetical protein